MQDFGQPMQNPFPGDPFEGILGSLEQDIISSSATPDPLTARNFTSHAETGFWQMDNLERLPGGAERATENRVVTKDVNLEDRWSQLASQLEESIEGTDVKPLVFEEPELFETESRACPQAAATETPPLPYYVENPQPLQHSVPLHPLTQRGGRGAGIRNLSEGASDDRYCPLMQDWVSAQEACEDGCEFFVYDSEAGEWCNYPYEGYRSG